MSDDGCSATCVLEGDFGGFCRVVDGMQWCYNDDACGEACEAVCSALGLTIEPSDAAWFAAQDSLAECQAISDAFGLTDQPNFGDHALGCLEDGGVNDLVGGGLTGSLFCSSDPTCPAAHRTDMDNIGTNCNLVGARRSVCPCAGEFCGNGVVEGTEFCDDGNQINNDGCTTTCIESGCGDGDIDEGEHCDPDSGFASAPCSTDCLFDFSGINQLYCNGTCTWAGGDSCDQADADIYCKLITGDPDSVATDFDIVVALDEPGFSCPNFAGVNLGPLPEFGVDVDVWFQDSSILLNHGAGSVVTNASCT
jgi:cysteine-rich repeat protein